MKKQSKLYRKILMQRYLYSGCEGLKQHFAMMKWIHEKGLSPVYEFMQDIFGESWSKSNIKAIKEERSHDQ